MYLTANENIFKVTKETAKTYTAIDIQTNETVRIRKAWNYSEWTPTFLNDDNKKDAYVIINMHNPTWGKATFFLNEAGDNIHEIRLRSGRRVLNNSEINGWAVTTWK